MVETRERDRVYTTERDNGPTTLLVVLFCLLIIAVLGFMVYFFSNSDLRNQPSVIERNTETAVPVPMPTPSAPAPNINVQPPSSGPSTINVQPPATAPRNDINITPPASTAGTGATGNGLGSPNNGTNDNGPGTSTNGTNDNGNTNP